MTTAAAIDFAAVTADTRRIANGTEWCLRYDGAVVAEGVCLGDALESRSAAYAAILAAREDRNAIADRYRFARYCRGRAG